MIDLEKLTPFQFFALTNFPYIEADFDALTNYQLFCEITKYLNGISSSQNDVISNFNELLQNWNDFSDAITSEWDETKDYIDNYFENLDVQEEINNKLDQMASDGTLLEVIQSTVVGEARTITENWLAQLTPSTEVIIDTTLTVAGACADAKATGDAISEVNGALDSSTDALYTSINEGKQVRTFYGFGIEKGLIAANTGQNYDAGVGYRTTGYITFNQANMIINYTGTTTNLRLRFFRYKRDNHSFVSISNNVNTFSNQSLTIDTSYDYRMVLYYTDSNDYPDPEKLTITSISDFYQETSDNIAILKNATYVSFDPVYNSIGDRFVTRNLMSFGVEKGQIASADGQNLNRGPGYRTYGYIKLPKNTIYINYTGTTTNLRLRLYKYDPSDHTYIGISNNVTNFKNSKLTVDNYYEYRLFLNYTDDSAYPDPTLLTIMYADEAIIRLSDFNWVSGKKINSDGTISGGYAQYTDGFIEFQNEVVLISDNSPDAANRSMTLAIYNTDESWNSRIDIGSVASQIRRIDTSKKYRLVYIDDTSTEIPDINGLSFKYLDLKAEYPRSLSSYRERKPMISIIDDDGMAEYYTYLLPIAQNYNIPIATAYEGYYNEFGYNSGFMSYQQLLDVYNSGNEVLGHANGSLESKTYSEAERDVKATKEIFESLGIPCRGYVYPASGGGATPTIRALLSKYYEYAIRGAEGTASDYRYNSGMIGNYFIIRVNGGGYYDDNTGTAWSAYNGYDLNYFKALIDAVKVNNGWLVLMLHARLMIDGQKQQAYENIDQLGLLEDIIEYAQAQNVDIVNPSEAYDVFGNVWQSGDYLGPWNNDMTKSGHTKAGCAVDRLGDTGFPS